MGRKCKESMEEFGILKLRRIDKVEKGIHYMEKFRNADDADWADKKGLKFCFGYSRMYKLDPIPVSKIRDEKIMIL